MKTFEQIYKPYDFSSTRCYVFRIVLNDSTYTKIEHKLPRFIQRLKGIFVTAKYNNAGTKLTGIISLNFNGQSLKCFHLPLIKTSELADYSHTVSVDEIIVKNSFVQGYFFRTDQAENPPGAITIYLHYEK